jgi:hypothetical protein
MEVAPVTSAMKKYDEHGADSPLAVSCGRALRERKAAQEPLSRTGPLLRAEWLPGHRVDAAARGAFQRRAVLARDCRRPWQPTAVCKPDRGQS